MHPWLSLLVGGAVWDLCPPQEWLSPQALRQNLLGS